MSGPVVGGPRIGVMAVQGDVAEHLAAIGSVGGQGIAVRRVPELEAVDGLILPGGESTTMIRLLRTFDLLSVLRSRIADGLPVYGSCAGMILLAEQVVGADGAPTDQETVGGLSIAVQRNAFGRQVESFEADLEVTGVPDPERRMHAVFIRAPWVERVDDGVEVLARARNHPVVVRQGALVASSFHPELTGDLRLHRALVDRCRR